MTGSSEFELHPAQVQVGKYGTVLEVIIAGDEIQGRAIVSLAWPKRAKIVPATLGTESHVQGEDIDVAIATIARRVAPDVERVISVQMRAAGLTP